VLGLVGNGTAQLAYSGAVATWFKRRRGLAFAILLGGSAFGATIWPIVVQALILRTSWRAAYAVIGCMILAFALPLGAQVKRRSDSAVAVHKENGAVAGLSSLAFWMIVIILFAASLGQNGALAHMAALLTDRGVSPAVAASAISVLGGCTLIGRVATGWLLDRFFAPYVSFGLLAIAGAGITLLSQAHSASFGLVAAALIGLGMGGEGDITPYLLSRYFNLKSFSTLYGFTWSAYAVAGAVGPVIMGRAFDHTGSYDRLLMKLSVLTLGTALLSLALPRYHEPVTAEAVPDLEVQVMDRG